MMLVHRSTTAAVSARSQRACPTIISQRVRSSVFTTFATAGEAAADAAPPAEGERRERRERRRNVPGQDRRPRVSGLPAVGTLVECTVRRVDPSRLLLDLPSNVPGYLHVSQVSTGHRIEDLTTAGLFQEGETIKAVVQAQERDTVRMATRPLEAEPGQMMKDKAAVFAGAEARMPQIQAELAMRLEAKNAVLESLKADEVHEAEVKSVRRGKGAFVMLKDIVMLVPIFKLPKGVLYKAGDKIKVKVVKSEDGKRTMLTAEGV